MQGRELSCWVQLRVTRVHDATEKILRERGVGYSHTFHPSHADSPLITAELKTATTPSTSNIFNFAHSTAPASLNQATSTNGANRASQFAFKPPTPVSAGGSDASPGTRTNGPASAVPDTPGSPAAPLAASSNSATPTLPFPISTAVPALSSAVGQKALDPEKVKAALTALADLGYTGLTAEDFGKLNPSDEYETELEVMAEVRAFFQVAYKVRRSIRGSPYDKSI